MPFVHVRLEQQAKHFDVDSRSFSTFVNFLQCKHETFTMRLELAPFSHNGEA